MGRSDPYLKSYYSQLIKPQGKVALLGFTNNEWFDGDLYDIQLDNWDINSNWKLQEKYDTIISLRCPYFAKDPEDFIKRCYENLNKNGKIYVEWGLGDHWRFKNYKIGWIKNGEQEYAYKEDNFLWSTVWHDSFLDNPNFKHFQENVKRKGYKDIKKAIFDEVSSIMPLGNLTKYFKSSYSMLSLWDDNPQLYILISGEKK